MIQDIFPSSLENSFLCRRPAKASDYVLIYRGRDETAVRIGSECENIFPKVSEVSGELTYLFSIDETAFFGIKDGIEICPEGFEFRSLRELRKDLSISKIMTFAAYSGIHLYIWYRDNRFCGRCGKPVEKSETERALICPECGNIIYPRIIPAVIVGVTNGDKLLLTKYKTGFNNFALVAGFTEFGETLEECVRREVFEETGLKVKNIRYYKSQPWGIVQDLLVGFFCEADGCTDITIDESELKLAGWYSRDEIQLHPDEMSLTGEMMKKFKNGEI